MIRGGLFCQQVALHDRFAELKLRLMSEDYTVALTREIDALRRTDQEWLRRIGGIELQRMPVPLSMQRVERLGRNLGAGVGPAGNSGEG